MTNTSRRIRTASVAALVTTILIGSAACNDYLKVTNPSAVDVSKLADSADANLLVNGAIGEFQTMIANTALYGGILTDESNSAHANVSYNLLDQRNLTDNLDLVSLTYSPIQRARFDGDTVANRLIGYDGSTAATDVRIARTLTFAAYSTLILGETFCAAPVQGGAAMTPAQLFAAAQPKFDSALVIARAASAANINKVVADSIVNLALVGAARTALDLGDRARAISYASQVTPDFVYRVYFAEGIPPSPALPVNPYWNGMGSPQASTAANGTSVSGGFSYASSALWIMVDSTFQNLNDPRVPTTPTQVKAMSASYFGYVANQPKSFGGYTAPSVAHPGGQAMTPGASIRIASYLEAQYIIAEANAGNATTLAFVNAQRAANGQPASVATSPTAVMADLRDQRRREFYLDGHRLGDLRRYIALYSVDQFPTGIVPHSAGTPYGTAVCFPIPISELNSNPNAAG
ncbi:MAG TPA: RagB/SusD family nutrient uptake outer membrane protein [Gemmatimonadaceae bacterium]|nr:RagB/SusD family nutrient uptake outer membrane protein [Gemmatimonadaceae bacterium]